MSHAALQLLTGTVQLMTFPTMIFIEDSGSAETHKKTIGERRKISINNHMDACSLDVLVKDSKYYAT